MKKALLTVPLMICGLAMNFLLVEGVFWSLYYEIHGASYAVTALIALAAALGADCLRRLYQKKLKIPAPVFLFFTYAPSIIATIVYRFFQAEPINELELEFNRENFLASLIGACVLAACGLVWLGISALGERAGKIRAVFLILICGFAVNYAACFVAMMLSFLTWSELTGYIAAAFLIIGLAALLNLVRRKCKKLPAVAVILCAQLPWVAWVIFDLVAASIYRRNMHGSMLAEFWAGTDVVFWTFGLIMGLLTGAGGFIGMREKSNNIISRE